MGVCRGRKALVAAMHIDKGGRGCGCRCRRLLAAIGGRQTGIIEIDGRLFVGARLMIPKYGAAARRIGGGQMHSLQLLVRVRQLCSGRRGQAQVPRQCSSGLVLVLVLLVSMLLITVVLVLMNDSVTLAGGCIAPLWPLVDRTTPQIPMMLAT